MALSQKKFKSQARKNAHKKIHKLKNFNNDITHSYSLFKSSTAMNMKLGV